MYDRNQLITMNEEDLRLIAAKNVEQLVSYSSVLKEYCMDYEFPKFLPTGTYDISRLNDSSI